MNEQALDYKMQGFAMRLHLTAYRTNFGNTTTNIKTNRLMYLSSQGLWTVLELAFMGVGCWFCSTAEGQYTYWTVTFN